MTIQLARSEILSHARVPWDTLNFSEKRRIASAILRDRGDDNSQQAAFYIETGNPNFNDFVIIENV